MPSFFRGAPVGTSVKDMTELDWLNMSMPHDVFDDEFAAQEIEFIGLDEEFEEGGVVLRLRTVHRRCDDYLNKNWRIGEFTVPILHIDEQLWMSLTPMEIQSNYMAWKMAGGLVGMGGLGLGYAPMRAAAEDEVERVYVYENDQRVIDFFLHRHRKREELKKITVVKVDDVRDTLTLDEDLPAFDFFYMDIYPALLGDEVLEDWKLMRDTMVAQEFRFWGQERVYLDGLSHEIIGPEELPMHDRAFLRKWQLSENAGMQLDNLDYAFIEQMLEIMQEYD